MDFVELKGMSGTRVSFKVYEIVAVLEENNRDNDGCMSGISLKGRSEHVYGIADSYDDVMKKINTTLGEVA